MLRSLLAAAALALAAPVYAQTNTQQVELLAPQLVPFSGSANNFDSLVNGLITGTPVTLTSLTPNGALQVVTFVPATRLTPVEAALALERARQNLISFGIAAPTGQQLAAALVGGTITTPSGSGTLTGVLSGTSTPSVPVLVRTDTTLPPAAGTSNLTPAQLQAVRNALANGSSVTLSTAANGAGQSVEFAATGRRLSDFEVNQALQLAATLLAQQGVLDPTAEQLRAALYGGSLQTLSGARIPVQGVLQGRFENTSDSRILGTSDSTVGATSASSTAGASTAPAPIQQTIGGVPTPGVASAPGGAPVATQRPAGPIRPGAR